jgi:hypothetical protein
MLRKLKTSNAPDGDSWPENGGGTAIRRDAADSKPSTITRHDEEPASAFPARFKPGSVALSPSAKSSSPTRSSPTRSSPSEVLAQAESQPAALSIRAENVLKNLAPELTGETPPKGRWLPPACLLRSLSYSDLVGARNCGPQTVDEIVRWAKSQGVIIKRPFHAGKSLSAMWRDLIAKARTQEYTKEEITEALERSIRRKNTRIPVGFQSILIILLNAAGN